MSIGASSGKLSFGSESAEFASFESDSHDDSDPSFTRNCAAADTTTTAAATATAAAAAAFSSDYTRSGSRKC